MSTRRFAQVDVFARAPLTGNPVAVVLDGEGLAGDDMQRFAHWTNLSETTFVTAPEQAGADYRVRIFTPSVELPFAGHPTLGTCHAWLEAGGVPAREGEVVQECGAGLVAIRRTPDGLAFAAPPVVRSGPVEDALADRVVAGLGVARSEVVAIEWAQNGPAWIAVLLESAEAVLALDPVSLDLEVGVAGPWPEGSPEAYEVRAFFPANGVTVEDPVTGSFNASLAQWLLRTGRAQAPYVAAQGTRLGRAGRVHISADADDVWVGGATITLIDGTVEL